MLSLFKLILDCKDNGLCSYYKGFGLYLLIVAHNNIIIQVAFFEAQSPLKQKL